MELLAILSMMAVGLALLAMYVHGTEQRPKPNDQVDFCERGAAE